MKLYNQQKQLILDLSSAKELNRGGEGVIYQHPSRSDRVLKVYHVAGKASFPDDFMNRLSRLPDNFVKPLALYYTQTGQIAGFEMDYLDTSKLVLLNLLFNHNTALSNGFDDAAMSDIIDRLGQIIEQAHAQGLIVGDFNPYNVYVEPNTYKLYVVDVDSMACSSKRHSDVILDEVRDWKAITVSDSTDRFAANVISFWLLTSVHPYKGIHQTVKTLEERVIKNMSILNTSTSVKTPGCYRKLSDTTLESSYRDYFDRKQDVLIRLNGKRVGTVKANPAIQINEGDLRILRIDVTGRVQRVQTVGSMMLVITTTGTYTYRSAGPGALLASRTTQKPLFISSSDVVSVVDQAGTYNYLNNDIKHNRVYQKGDALFMLDDSSDTYRLINLGQNLRGRFTETASNMVVRSVRGDYSPIQTVGGRTWLLDLTPTIFRMLPLTDDVQNVYSRGDYHLLEHKQKTGVTYELTVRDGLKLRLITTLPEMVFFDVKDGLIYLPADGGIEVMRSIDGMVIAKLSCSLVTAQSRLYHTPAGLLVQDSGDIYLLNKK